MTRPSHGQIGSASSRFSARGPYCAPSLLAGPPSAPPSSAETLSEDCRIYALSDIPILTWKSRAVSRSDAYCLFLISNLGYLQKDTTEMAARWAMLSEMLAFTALPSSALLVSLPPSVIADGPMELDRRINGLLALNAQVQRVLYNRPSDDEISSSHVLEGMARSLENSHVVHGWSPAMPDASWHQSSVSDQDGTSTAPAAPPDQGFFDLFLPLRALLKAAMSSPRQGDIAHNHVAHGLEDYFINFPTSIMEFSAISLPWQLEAMIWFHGIYLLLTCGPDIYNVIVDPNFASSVVFAHAADHAVPLGEILPYLLTLESAMLRVMPLTIYFVALSAAGHIGLLQHVYRGLSAPLLLLGSAQQHSDALGAILEASRTCDHPSIQSVEGILSLILSARSNGTNVEPESLSAYMENLQCYRWVPGGRGLLPIDQTSAMALIQSPSTGSDIDMSLAPSPGLQTVLDPNSRINRPGTFDLSILF
ncbi:hypothetical protein ACJ41O_003666 [Fusarium nematophilum]